MICHPDRGHLKRSQNRFGLIIRTRSNVADLKNDLRRGRVLTKQPSAQFAAFELWTHFVERNSRRSNESNIAILQRKTDVGGIIDAVISMSASRSVAFCPHRTPPHRNS
jgi:hypothetical protein